MAVRGLPQHVSIAHGDVGVKEECYLTFCLWDSNGCPPVIAGALLCIGSGKVNNGLFFATYAVLETTTEQNIERVSLIQHAHTRTTPAIHQLLRVWNGTCAYY